MADKITYGIIGIIVVASIASGIYYFNQDEFKNAYVCTTNNVTGIFERLSSTNKTGYWTNESGSFSVVCRNGYWVPLNDFATQYKIDVNDLTKNGVQVLPDNVSEIINECQQLNSTLYKQKNCNDIYGSTQCDYKVNYTCNTTMKSAVNFTRLSVSNKTGYYDENATENSMQCTNGLWIAISPPIANCSNYTAPNIRICGDAVNVQVLDCGVAI